jgi:predicted nucleic acid-binding Zn ribbon protein
MKHRRQPSAKSLASALDDMIEAFSLTKIREYNAVTHWSDIVGERIARVSEAVRIERGVLVVKVTNGPWRNELNVMKAEILAKVNQAAGQGKLRDIRFV